MSLDWYKEFASQSLRETRFFTAEQTGMYVKLKWECWHSEPHGSVSSIPDEVWQLAGATSKARFEETCGPILQHFELRGDRYHHKALMVQVEYLQDLREKRSAAGKLGAEKTNGAASAAGVPQQNPASAAGVPQQNPADKKRERLEKKRKERGRGGQGEKPAPCGAWATGVAASLVEADADSDDDIPF